MNGGWGTIVALTLILAALIGLHWLIAPNPDRRNYEFLPNMVESVPRNAQAAPLVLDDGTVVDRRIPSGSVARGHLPLPFAATPEGALLAGRTLENPLADDDFEAEQRGAEIFENFCIVCHGPAGLGDGPVAKRGVPPPPSFLAENAMNMSDGQMYHLITLGQANMAGYAAQVPAADRWKVIRHIRKLQRSGTAPAAENATEGTP